jgi:hypothetical protein
MHSNSNAGHISICWLDCCKSCLQQSVATCTPGCTELQSCWHCTMPPWCSASTIASCMWVSWHYRASFTHEVCIQKPSCGLSPAVLRVFIAWSLVGPIIQVTAAFKTHSRLCCPCPSHALALANWRCHYLVASLCLSQVCTLHVGSHLNALSQRTHPTPQCARACPSL